MAIQKSTLIVAVAAFITGAAVSWLVLVNQRSTGLQQPPTYLVSSPATGAGETAGAAQPDVSQLPPGQSALVLGNWNYDQKNWSKAIEDYQRAISLGTDDANVQTDLGNAFRFSGKPEKALELYQSAQRKDPQHENSLYNMAALYDGELHNHAAAVRTMQDYLRRFPNGEKAAIAKQFVEQSGTGSPVGN